MEPRRVRRGPGVSTGFIVGAALVSLLALLAFSRIGDLIDFVTDPFAQESTDRSQPALLEALSDLSEYRAATAELQVIIDVERSRRFLPSFISGERTVFLAGGSVDAAVDFDGLDDGAITISGDSVRIVVPPARLTDAMIDPESSFVINRERGVLDRIAGVFSDNPTSERELYLLAEDRLLEAADASALRSRAEENTRAMLQALVGSLGFDEVTVVFETDSRA